MQTARSINLLLFSYANDNNQQYPDGKSSTEVFQKLLDGGYATDPAIFYVPLPGKVKPVEGQKLKPENVCWDVTCSVDASDSDYLPLVFLTGYKVTYAPGAAAARLANPYPEVGQTSRTWSQWWNDEPHDIGKNGIAVGYKSNSAMFMRIIKNSDNDTGSIPNFISPDFKPKGKVYSQLTPDGPLP